MPMMEAMMKTIPNSMLIGPPCIVPAILEVWTGQGGTEADFAGRKLGWIESVGGEQEGREFPATKDHRAHHSSSL